MVGLEVLPMCVDDLSGNGTSLPSSLRLLLDTSDVVYNVYKKLKFKNLAKSITLSWDSNGIPG